MRQKSGQSKAAADKVVKGIRRKTRKHYSAEETVVNLSTVTFPAVLTPIIIKYFVHLIRSIGTIEMAGR